MSHRAEPAGPHGILGQPAHRDPDALDRLLVRGHRSRAVEIFELKPIVRQRPEDRLYGAARAAKLAGDMPKASRYFGELAELTKTSDGARAEVKEARAFATATAEK